jgi:hypothetical protein
MVIKNNVKGKEMMQTGLLDWQIRFEQLDQGGDPLPRIQAWADWRRFRPLLWQFRFNEFRILESQIIRGCLNELKNVPRKEKECRGNGQKETVISLDT